MSAIIFWQLLFITAKSSWLSTAYVINAPHLLAKRSSLVNLCQPPCPLSCSPCCLPTCCVGNSQTPVPPAKPEFVISSVEEGETEECDDKGFKSPNDNSEDPPGTITIPFPPTLYTPPKPGEAPKELPIPDFKLPASILQGKLPSNSMTLSPEPPTLASANPPPLGNPETESSVPVLDIGHNKVPPPIPASANTLLYPKLPPVTVSEIPGKKPITPVIKPPLAPLIKSPLPPALSAEVPSSAPPLLPPVKLSPLTVPDITNSKPLTPVIKPPLPTALLPTLPPPIITSLNKLACPLSCPTHCVPECRDDCCTVTPVVPASPPVNAPGTNGLGAAVPPATNVPGKIEPASTDASNSAVPGVLEVSPSVVSLSGSPSCGHTNDNKPTYDPTIIKEMQQELNSRYL